MKEIIPVTTGDGRIDFVDETGRPLPDFQAATPQEVGFIARSLLSTAGA